MNATVDMGDLLEISLDDLADLPEFKPYPAGSHRSIFTWKLGKTKEGKNQVIVNLTAIETEELADPISDVPLEPGTETSIFYDLSNELAQGKLKPILKTLAEFHGTKGLFETLNAANNMEMVVVTKIRENKDKSQKYTDLVTVIL